MPKMFNSSVTVKAMLRFRRSRRENRSKFTVTVARGHRMIWVPHWKISGGGLAAS